MTTQQLNLSLFFITLAIMGFSVWLVFAASKFGEKLDREAKAKKSAKSVKTKKLKRKEVK